MRTVLLGFLVVAGLVVAGCNTAEGVGEDIEGTGEAIQRTVD